MRVTDAQLPDVKIIQPSLFEDDRGYFMESYSYKALQQHGISIDFVQDNHSLSLLAGTLRGLHYQLEPKAQTKLVRVTAGAIYDVVVDLRRGSPTFGMWEGFTLSAENKLQLLVPKGFAHGFCTIAPHTEIQYKVDNDYAAEHERGIIWNDPMLSIDWPVMEPVLSNKDQRNGLFVQSEYDFLYKG
ncbi:dTDP-4-dehydrorhamnose 3,5-epimerase [Paenibacillus sp. R14(2021)]|uniref:dTDP-4-dehydrorhamnose 3,5-epimerase n=1 Tax=Paenibacillus sp. R14(2021) TaxID=2859228 RepID=UPI001C615C41|nr:dTDP-4-dehydrorhamnose 3,5-epimerase [Paenibacillus sp. R14(2021)]